MATKKGTTTTNGGAAANQDNSATSGVKTYTVVNTVNHDHRLYDPGSPIDLDDETAAPLLKVGAIADDGDDATA